MCKVNITKAVASGNDFLIVDNRDNNLSGIIKDFKEFAKIACRRKHSIGADGLLVLQDSKSADFRMRIFNPDGSEVTMCGNGIRCSSLYAYDRKWCGDIMTIETGAGILEAQIMGDISTTEREGLTGGVKIKMTPPKDIKLDNSIGVGKTIMNINSVNTGVPHAIHFVDDIEKYPVKNVGSKIRYHKFFEPDGTNVDFVEIKDKSNIVVRTYERGVEDETLACGTGIVASAIISHLVEDIVSPVSVLTRSGDIVKVYFKKERNGFSSVYLEGKAHIVFEGGMHYV